MGESEARRRPHRDAPPRRRGRQRLRRLPRRMVHRVRRARRGLHNAELHVFKFPATHHAVVPRPHIRHHAAQHLGGAGGPVHHPAQDEAPELDAAQELRSHAAAPRQGALRQRLHELPHRGVISRKPPALVPGVFRRHHPRERESVAIPRGETPQVPVPSLERRQRARLRALPQLTQNLLRANRQRWRAPRASPSVEHDHGRPRGASGLRYRLRNCRGGRRNPS